MTNKLGAVAMLLMAACSSGARSDTEHTAAGAHEPSRATHTASELEADPPTAPPTRATLRDNACATDSTCERKLSDIVARIEGQRHRLQTVTPRWQHYAELAALYQGHARLTGEYSSFGHARQALEDAFAVAPAGTGPFLARAQLNFTMHRFAEVEPDLRRVEVSPAGAKHAAQIAGMRADLALYSGRYERAGEAYRKLVDEHPSMDSFVRYAHFLSRTGRFDEADAWMVKAAQSVTPRFEHTHAWLALQRGLLDLDRGRLEEALAHYEAGAELFDGWYLLDEHIAEIVAAQGETTDAIARYEQLVARTGNPEFMAALAGVLHDAGEHEAARRWTERATQAFEAQIASFPSAAGGHALEFFLEHGTADRARTLAEANEAARPFGESHVMLAQALVRTGDLPEANSLLRDALASPYRSASLHATAAAVGDMLGDASFAAEQRAAARAIDPGSVEDLAWLQRT